MVSIKIGGVQSTIKSILSINKRLAAELKRDMNDVALFMEAEVKASIAGHRAESRSVDTGRFLNSIKGKGFVGSAVVRSTVPYGKFLEFDVKNRSGRYHFRNSLFRNKKKIKDFLGRSISASIK